ncbi:MAG TPA: hypothetical protein DIS62_00155 [Candidatus Kerfeldbacteria bacterium]|nr:MAG: hypothetical protein UY34_C0019G0071 [Parcubacteria group bacterium GW2011_GWA2_48_9]HCM67407.1 hypothetical protein [Candidatus Kerfeldbacteria bacterium]
MRYSGIGHQTVRTGDVKMMTAANVSSKNVTRIMLLYLAFFVNPYKGKSPRADACGENIAPR